jgi:hypothetical protein
MDNNMTSSIIDQIYISVALGLEIKITNRKKKKNFFFLLKFFSLLAAFYETQQAQ